MEDKNTIVMEKNEKNIYESSYSDNSFWDKTKSFAKTAGKEVIEKALTLYFVLQKPDVPAKVKVTIIAALGYFISPIDAIPDMIPFVGFSDDLGALAIAFATVAMYVDDSVKAQVAQKMHDWFD